MKAAIVEKPGCLIIGDLPEPEVGPYDLLTEQLYGSICAATDRHLIAGDLPIPGITYPLILGHESIGRVVEVGAKVRHVKTGDLVTRTGLPALGGCVPFWGGFAELGIAKDFRAMKEDGLPQEEWSPYEVNLTLPHDMDPAAATMMITWRETYSYLTRLKVKPGDAVLVLGSGGNGFSFAALAHAFKATVSMLGNRQWRTLAQEAGVAAFADYHDEGAMESLQTAAPNGYDLIIDAVGRTGGLEAAIPFLKPGGSVGLHGIQDLGERLAYLERLIAKGYRAHGPVEYKEAEAHDGVLTLFEEGLLKADIWFDPSAPTPLERISDAFDAIEERKSLKAVVKLRT